MILRISILSRQLYLLALLSLLTLSFLIHSSQAQNTPDSAPNPIVPAEPELDAPEEMVGIIELVDDSASQVLTLLEQMTDKIILRHQSLPTIKITFDSRGPLTKREAVLAIESLLTLNGVMLTDMGGRFMKAVPATNVNTHVPQMLAGSTLQMAPSQQIYAKLFRLDYLNAESAGAPLVQNLVSGTSNIIPFPKSNALLVTDALINLQRIETVINEADRPQAVRETIKFVKLNYVQAPNMQSRIESLIQGPLRSYLEGNTSVTADERSNQLIVITHPGNLDIILEVIESVDVDAAALTSSEVFPLRQAKAQEVVPIINEIIEGQRKGREENAQTTRENQRDAILGGGGNEGQTAQGQTTPTPTATSPASGASEANSSLQFSNFVGLSADERTNAIVAYGTQQDLKTLRELIEKIDIPLQQVVIEAIITEVNLTENQASGLSSFGFQYVGGTNIFSGINIQGAGIATVPEQTSIDLNKPSDFNLGLVIESAAGDSNVRILSTPRIVVSHAEEGVINVSQSRPIITGSTSSGISENLNTRSTIEFRDIGIRLKVTPLIGADGTVQMEIEQTVENVVSTTRIDGNEQPIIGKREATSTISVKDGQIIILGGLQENSATDSNNYWPLLGRLPGIGSFFGGDSQDFRRTELIIFIRPTILSNPAIADAISSDYVGKARESEAIKEYLETGSTSDIYMEGSRFEKKEKPAEGPSENSRPGPRSHRR
ncbi:MAG: hypothetical protein EA353_11365 [Puniceicoccaceae bacterium]|nr:MAG: hypothetical protein EA353_11365 [Puniceicoccaceae bacterium]